MGTIAAISTAPANGGIGIIRMSGKECFEILDKIFVPKQKQDIEEISGYTIKYGYIIDFKTKQKIDEVLVSFFKSPKSYTTENMCEINSHGGVVIEQKILEQCLLAGAEMAEPGEFTKRAFLNGRIDLSQAEGIIDLINAKTAQEAKASFKQLEGNLSKKIQDIRQELLNIIPKGQINNRELMSDTNLRELTPRKEKIPTYTKDFEQGRLPMKRKLTKLPQPLAI